VGALTSRSGSEPLSDVSSLHPKAKRCNSAAIILQLQSPGSCFRLGPLAAVCRSRQGARHRARRNRQGIRFSASVSKLVVASPMGVGTPPSKDSLGAWCKYRDPARACRRKWGRGSIVNWPLSAPSSLAQTAWALPAGGTFTTTDFPAERAICVEPRSGVCRNTTPCGGDRASWPACRSACRSTSPARPHIRAPEKAGRDPRTFSDGGIRSGQQARRPSR